MPKRKRESIVADRRRQTLQQRRQARERRRLARPPLGNNRTSELAMARIWQEAFELANANRFDDDHNDLSYEELLAIGDALGEVKRKGFTEPEIDQIPFHRAKTDETGECAICLSDVQVGNYVIKLDCQHVFHCKCLKEWLAEKATCPICREKVKRPEFVIND